MFTRAHPREVSESVWMHVSPPVAFEAVSDVERMAEWSPEVTQVEVLKGVPSGVGLRFRGRNSIQGRKWSTVSTVVDHDPPSRFAFEVSALGPVSRWTYDFQPEADGVRVTETWVDLRRGVRGACAALIGGLYGVRERSAHNRRTMRATLTAMKTSLEAMDQRVK